MKIEDHFDADLSCPLNGLVEVRCSALCVRRVGIVERPVSNGDPDNVEATARNLLEVRKLYPAIPMGLQNFIVSLVSSKRLCQSVLVDNAARAIELLEDRGCNPRLEDEPATEIDSTDFLIAPVETASWAVSLGDQSPRKRG